MDFYVISAAKETIFLPICNIQLAVVLANVIKVVLLRKENLNG
jgi:hypothetical protein